MHAVPKGWTKTMVACLVLAGLALAGPGTAIAQTPAAQTVSGVGPPTPIAAWNGRLVWSRPNGKGGFQLVQQVAGGAVQVLPVAPRGVPFDVDLGPTSSGNVFAVYSRCHIEPSWPGQMQMPAYETGTGCDIYRLDLSSNTEVRFTAVNASNASEYWPSYWKGTIAYGRAYESNPSAGLLYSKVVASNAPSQREGLGPRGLGAYTPQQIELFGTHLGFGWKYQANASTPSTPRAPSYALWLDTLGTSGRQLDSFTKAGTSTTMIGWPAFPGNGDINWLRSCDGDPGGCANRGFYSAPYAGTPALLAASPQWVLSFEVNPNKFPIPTSSITWAETQDNSASTYNCVAATPNPPPANDCSIQTLQPRYGAPGGGS